MPKISVIVPVYNVEMYLRECLDSLLGQTLTDIELLCINDGSMDSSLEILKEYEALDDRVRLITKENEGYGKTMNLGLAQAKAPYIGIVESDDFVRPDMFEKLYQAMTVRSVDLVKCNFYRYTVAGGKDIGYSHEYPEDLFGQVIEPIDHPDVYFANSSIWAALYKKDFLDRHDIRFNETPGAAYQDISFQFKVLSSAKKMLVIKDALLYYRSDNLMSSVHSPFKVYCVCDEMHAIEDYIKTQGKERQKKLWPLSTKRKYYDYLWNYRRLAPVFQFAFYEKMIAEFQDEHAKGRFEHVAWKSSFDRENFEKMMADPLKYFMQTSKRDKDDRIQRAGIKNDRLAEIGFFATIRSEEQIILYGAGKVGRYVAERLKAIGIAGERLLFAVTDADTAEPEYDGIPVRQIDELMSEQTDRSVLLSVKGEKQIDMLNRLLYLGCDNIILVDDVILSYLK